MSLRQEKMIFSFLPEANVRVILRTGIFFWQFDWSLILIQLKTQKTNGQRKARVGNYKASKRLLFDQTSHGTNVLGFMVEGDLLQSLDPFFGSFVAWTSDDEICDVDEIKATWDYYCTLIDVAPAVRERLVRKSIQQALVLEKKSQKTWLPSCSQTRKFRSCSTTHVRLLSHSYVAYVSKLENLTIL